MSGVELIIAPYVAKLYAMATVGPVLSILRAETGQSHQRLEARMNAIERLAGDDSRHDLIRRYHQFHTSLENAIAPFADKLGLTDWRRGPLIDESMAILNLSPLPAHAPPALANLEQALGALYVLEGSSLGGRMILKDLANRGVERRGLEFLDPHGDAVGEKWRAFMATLEEEVCDPHQAARGALAAFAQAEDILCIRQDA